MTMTNGIEVVTLFGSKVGFKKCCRCGEVKSVDNFYNYKASPNGKMSHCKKCHSNYPKLDSNRVVKEVKPTLSGINVSDLSDDVGRINMMNRFGYLQSALRNE